MVAYIPSILVSTKVFGGSATALYLSMYIPHFALIIVFGVRMAMNMKSMATGHPGAWTAHAMDTKDQNRPLYVLVGDVPEIQNRNKNAFSIQQPESEKTEKTPLLE